MLTTVVGNGKAIDAGELKRRASGRWLEILEHVAGIDPALLDGHCPCPKCGGTDRFRMIDADAGAVFCNQCFNQGNGDGLAAVRWMLDCDFPTACHAVADFLGYSGDGRTNGHRDIVADVARGKGVPLESWKAFGATRATRGKLEVCRFPMFDEHGEQCGNFDLATIDAKWLKGLIVKGDDAGLFLEGGQLPRAGETVHIVEGVKDAAALHGLGLASVGLPTKEMDAKFARVFRGVHVVIIPDRDKAGEAGAHKTAGRLRGVAASVKIATLPGEWKETNGDDVRDVLKKANGENLVRQAIADAVEWKPGDGGEAKAPKQERRRITMITSEELAKADFKQEFFVEGVLAKDQHCVASGGKKTLKTSTLIDLALSVAAGRPFLEKFFTNKGRVGIFSGESGRTTIQETALRIAKAKGMPLQNFNMLWSFDLPQFDHFDDLQQVRSLIEANGLELVILDPAYLCMNLTDGASNLFAVGEKLQILTNLGRETGATIILCHHNRKGLLNPFEPPELEDMYGSGFAEWARQWLLFGRRSRFDPEDPNGFHELWLNYGGSAGHSGMWALDIQEGKPEDPGGRRWEVEIVKASSARANAAKEAEEAKQNRKDHAKTRQWESDRSKVLEAMRELNQASSKTKVRTEAKLSSDRITPILDSLVEEGLVETCPIIAGNKPVEGFRLANSESVRGESDPVRPSPTRVGPNLLVGPGGESDPDKPPIGGLSGRPDRPTASELPKTDADQNQSWSDYPTGDGDDEWGEI